MTKPNKDDISKVMSELGKRSGKNMTAKQRKERAQKAVKARWDKQKTGDKLAD